MSKFAALDDFDDVAEEVGPDDQECSQQTSSSSSSNSSWSSAVSEQDDNEWTSVKRPISRKMKKKHEQKEKMKDEKAQSNCVIVLIDACHVNKMKEELSKIGEIVRTSVSPAQHYGFFEFKTVEEARRAIEEYDGKNITILRNHKEETHKLTLSFANPMDTPFARVSFPRTKPKAWLEQELAAFSPKKVSLNRNEKGHRNGVAWVSFHDEKEAEACVKGLNDKPISQDVTTKFSAVLVTPSSEYWEPMMASFSYSRTQSKERGGGRLGRGRGRGR